MRVSPGPGSMSLGAAYFNTTAVGVDVCGARATAARVRVAVGVTVAVGAGVLLGGTAVVAITVTGGGRGVSVGSDVAVATTATGAEVGLGVGVDGPNIQPVSDAARKTSKSNGFIIVNVPTP